MSSWSPGEDPCVPPRLCIQASGYSSLHTICSYLRFIQEGIVGNSLIFNLAERVELHCLEAALLHHHKQISHHRDKPLLCNFPQSPI